MAKEKLVIGLTGGIGSGKSEVATRFAKLGAEVIDADQLAHQLLQPGNKQFTATVKRFGADILCSDGTIDRALLAKIIFNNPREQRWLEQLLHPAIREIMSQQIADSSAAYTILVIPLLVENWPHPLINRVLVVDSTRALQQARTRRRDRASREKIDAVMARQASREQRLSHADDVIDNRGNLNELNAKVAKLHHHYLTLCAKT
ncbi:MAG: dephospho-CoA kinase [Gammaproteobacteria bacterium]|nr:dephospho-CoA kinase [Gammaproteobacteria bacterium]